MYSVADKDSDPVLALDFPQCFLKNMLIAWSYVKNAHGKMVRT